jgi:Transposase
MAAVMIGVDPRKGSHTAVVIGAAEEPQGELRVRASKTQADELVAWAAAWPRRTWAVEGAGGLGRLLAQQLIAAGERVLDVQPKLAARVRLLEAGDTNKNDPDDALSVAVAALRSKASREVTADDYTAVLKVWSKRHRDLSRTRNQVACRLHAVLCELIPGGHSKEISAAQAAKILDQPAPSGAVAPARAELAAARPQSGGPPAARTRPAPRPRPPAPRPRPAARPRRRAASPASHTGTGHPAPRAAEPAASSPPAAAPPGQHPARRRPRRPPA